MIAPFNGAKDTMLNNGKRSFGVYFNSINLFGILHCSFGCMFTIAF